MGIENMRRWPMYIVYAFCFILVLSVLNSWSIETELRDQIAGISLQLEECSKQQSSCLEESLSLMELKDNYLSKLNHNIKENGRLHENLTELKQAFNEKDSLNNRSKVDLQICNTELDSLRNLQQSKSATLDALRLEKDRLTAELKEHKDKLEELEMEVEKMKSLAENKAVLEHKSPVETNVRVALPVAKAELVSPKMDAALPKVESVLMKVTPSAALVKSSPLENRDPINEPVLDNDAKEDLDETNVVENNAFESDINT